MLQNLNTSSHLIFETSSYQSERFGGLSLDVNRQWVVLKISSRMMWIVPAHVIYIIDSGRSISENLRWRRLPYAGDRVISLEFDFDSYFLHGVLPLAIYIYIYIYYVVNLAVTSSNHRNSRKMGCTANPHNIYFSYMLWLSPGNPEYDMQQMTSKDWKVFKASATGRLGDATCNKISIKSYSCSPVFTLPIHFNPFRKDRT